MCRLVLHVGQKSFLLALNCFFGQVRSICSVVIKMFSSQCCRHTCMFQSVHVYSICIYCAWLTFTSTLANRTLTHLLQVSHVLLDMEFYTQSRTNTVSHLNEHMHMCTQLPSKQTIREVTMQWGSPFIFFFYEWGKRLLLVVFHKAVNSVISAN